MIQIEMEMPVSCGRCRFSAQRQMSLGSALKCMVIGGDVGCSYDDKHDVLNKRHPNCPLHEVTDSEQPEVRPIDYFDCSNAMLKMWMDNVVTDGEYNRIMDKLNAYWGKNNG